MTVLSNAKQTALKAAFDRGKGPYAAARLVGVTFETARDYFVRFGWVSPRQDQEEHRFTHAPRYTGPDWIGKAITPPSDPPAGQPAID